MRILVLWFRDAGFLFGFSGYDREPGTYGKFVYS